tara:strand:- start:5063 stop:6391 length:1329 start_codon:yes stop_codon:yes gene_type:complete
MKITRKDRDSVNSIISISIDKKDYTEKVEDTLKNYQKKANISGFRKGRIPMGLIKNKYQDSVRIEEINKILQENLINYLNKEKIVILGNPLPVLKDKLDWKAKEIVFEFQIGLRPKINPKFNFKKKLTKYKITADTKMINNQISYLQNKFSNIEKKDKIEKNNEFTVEIIDNIKGVNKNLTLKLEQLKSKKVKDIFLTKKENELLEISTNNFLKNEEDYERLIGIKYVELNNINPILNLKIKNIILRVPAKLDINLFKNIFGESVKNLKDFRLKIRADLENQLEVQSNQKFISDVDTYLVDNIEFKLPDEFLIKWIKSTNEKITNENQAKEEFLKSEKSIRLQIIKENLIETNNLSIGEDEVKMFTKNMIKNQMAQYGNNNPDENELNEISKRVLKNENEVNRIESELINDKLKTFYNKKISYKLVKLGYEEFLKIAYGSKQ